MWLAASKHDTPRLRSKNTVNIFLKNFRASGCGATGSRRVWMRELSRDEFLHGEAAADLTL